MAANEVLREGVQIVPDILGGFERAWKTRCLGRAVLVSDGDFAAWKQIQVDDHEPILKYRWWESETVCACLSGAALPLFFWGLVSRSWIPASISFFVAVGCFFGERIITKHRRAKQRELQERHRVGILERKRAILKQYGIADLAKNAWIFEERNLSYLIVPD